MANKKPNISSINDVGSKKNVDDIMNGKNPNDSNHESLSNVYKQDPSSSDYETNFEDEDQLKGPLSLWIGAMVVGILLIIFATIPILSPFSNLLNKIGYYIIYLPGALVFPLIVGIWIGIKTSKRRIMHSIKSSFINSVYASIIYVIAMSIIYITLHYTSTLLSSITIMDFVEKVSVIPVGIVIILSIIISVFRSARKRVQ